MFNFTDEKTQEFERLKKKAFEAEMVTDLAQETFKKLLGVNLGKSLKEQHEDLKQDVLLNKMKAEFE